jgi:pilus assembly protein Flp/PilA
MVEWIAVRKASYREQLLQRLPHIIGFRLAGILAQESAREPEDAMKNLAMKVQRFLVSEDGPTAVEYAVMLALIVIVCLTAIRSIGTNANTTFTNVAKQLG